MISSIEGLDSLLKKYQKLVNIDSDVIKKATDVGKEIANKRYSIRNVDTNIPLVEGIIKSRKKGQVVATGEKLTFEEYGTGTIGKQSGYPQEKLPKKGIPNTKSWIYNYPSRFKRVSKNTGETFWFYKKPDGEVVTSKGQKAGMQMYNTSRELQKQKSNIVNSVVRKLNRGE